MKTGKWRHELKYTITMSEYLGMRSCISEIMHHDPHSDGKPYVIESLYFDGLGDKALKEKIFGVNEREIQDTPLQRRHFLHKTRKETEEGRPVP